MPASHHHLKTCKKGHTYHKTSDCPTCPVCETERKPKEGILSLIGAPARRALEHAGIRDLTALSKHTEAELLDLHGMGPKAVSILKEALAKEKMAFKK